MTPKQIDLVRASYAQVSILANQPAAIFLDHLFAAEPALRWEFLDNYWLEGERLMRMLTSTIFLLDRPGELQSALELLGARLLDGRSAGRRQQAFCTALMRTLEGCLQSSFTSDVRDAWLALCTFAGRCLTQQVPAQAVEAA